MKIFLIIIFIIFPFFLSAQTGKMSIGLSSGLSFSKINLDENTLIVIDGRNILSMDGVKAKLKTNISTGIDFQYYITDKISIQSGLLYTAKGIEYDYDPEMRFIDELGETIYSITLEYDMNSNYEFIEIPLLIQYTVGSKLQFTASAGLSANILLNKYYGITVKEPEGYIIDAYSKEIKTNDIITSLIFGGKVKYNLNEKFSYLLDFRYNYDLTKIYDYSENDLLELDNSKNTFFGIDANSKFRSFSISLGLAYNLN